MYERLIQLIFIHHHRNNEYSVIQKLDIFNGRAFIGLFWEIHCFKKNPINFG